ncbi:MAG: hypothetical protein L3J91_00120 [Thermoplasmata archaeon]|nr:hypothetical protein [Thermoplasmata archaeon]
MWREWSRTRKILVVVLVALAAWELAGVAIQVGTSGASSSSLSNAFVPTKITPPGGYTGSGSTVFYCIESASNFADCVSSLIAGALAGFFGQIQAWVSNFIANIFGSIFNWLSSVVNQVLGAVEGAIASIIGAIGSVFALLFNTLEAWSAPFGPLAPVIVVTFSLLLFLLGGIAFYFVLILMFAVGKTVVSLL